jgi:HK97 family phage major capsid protein
MLGVLELALENNNVPGLALYWIMAPRTKKFLMNMRDGNGNRIYPELSTSTPTLRGIEVKTTTNIPINLSPGTASEIMLVDASQQLIGQNPRVNIAASTETTYQDAGGNWVSAFQRNETVLRMIVYNDINTQHPESIAILTGVRWGAAS